MMLKILFWPVMLLFVAVDDSDRPRSLVSGYHAMDDGANPLRVLRDWLAAQGAPPPDTPPGGGGGALITVGKTVIDTGGSGAGDDFATESRALSYGSGQGYVSVGRMLAQTRWFRVYPLVGVGGFGGGAKSEPVSDSDGSEPSQTGWFGAFASGGVGIDFTLRVWRFEGFVGLRSGFRLAMGTVQLGEGEDLPPVSGPFFRVVIGAGLRR